MASIFMLSKNHNHHDMTRHNRMNKISILTLLLLFCIYFYPALNLHSSEGENVKLNTHKLSDAELKFWNDTQFQKEFIRSYKSETEIEPTVTVDERDMMTEVLNLISDDKMNEAANILQDSRNETASAVIDFTLANIYFQQEDFDKAASIYQDAVDKFPKFRRAWNNLGIIYVRQNKYEEAIPALTRVIELGGYNGITFGLLGFSYTSIENYLSAESAYRMAILLDADTMDWKMGLARCFFKQERFGEAVALCGQLIKQFPERSDLWLLQANAYIGLEKPLEAAEIYEVVDQLGKATQDSLKMLADIYINEKLYELATDTYIRAMEKDPEQFTNQAIRSAKILSARGAFEQTREIISRINEVYDGKLSDDERNELLKIEARLAVADGSDEEEVQVLKEIVQLDPMDGEALLLLGQHYAREGNTEKAIFYYERAANIENYEADAKVRHAQLLVRNGKYQEALPLLRSAQQVNHRDNIQEYLEQVERVAKNR